MTKGLIYMVDAKGGLTAMSPSAPRNEDSMQALVARHPELISDDDGDLLLIRREQPISDTIDGSGRWSVDHLFVTRLGVPVLVELKRAVDTRLRREIVGQLLDYAANATAYWQAGRIADEFAKTAVAAGFDPETVLREFIPEIEPSHFWTTVDDNFRLGSVKLVFVADVIPPELARIVEFLNDQMRADVRAIELRWFENVATGFTALSPRVIGETARGTAVKAAARGVLPAIEADEWIAMKLGSGGANTVEAAKHFVEMVRGLGGTADPTNAQGSIIATFNDKNGKPLYPFLLVPTAGGQVQLALGYLKNRDAFKSEAIRQQLFEGLRAITGSLTNRPLHGYPAFPVVALIEPRVRNLVSDFLKQIVDRSRE